MLAERWLTRKPGSRMGAAKVNAPAKREAVACEAPVPAAVTVKVEVPVQPVTTIDYAFSLPLLSMATGYDLLDVLQAAGATVDHKRRRWTYPLSMRPAVHELVTLWADGSNLPRRCGELSRITACSETSTHATIQPSPPVVDVLAGNLHPDIARMTRQAEPEPPKHTVDSLVSTDCPPQPNSCMEPVTDGILTMDTQHIETEIAQCKAALRSPHRPFESRRLFRRLELLTVKNSID